MLSIASCGSSGTGGRAGSVWLTSRRSNGGGAGASRAGTIIIMSYLLVYTTTATTILVVPGVAMRCKTRYTKMALALQVWGGRSLPTPLPQEVGLFRPGAGMCDEARARNTRYVVE